MPNTEPPIVTIEALCEYRQEMDQAISELGLQGFRPLMTIQITESTTPEFIKQAKQLGVVAGKIYPRGMTTNSENGVLNYNKLFFSVFDAMQSEGMVLLLHGESPQAVDCLNREVEFLSILRHIANTFRDLRIVLEHVTTTEAVVCVRKLGPNVAATITLHHLLLTLNDVIGGKLKPHNFCKPVAKRVADRETLIKAAIGGNSKFFFGSDSAPHLRTAKECADGCAGIFTAPVVLPLLATEFERYNALDRLEDFTSTFGAKFYGLSLNSKTITLRRQLWTVPDEICGVVPFYTGQKIGWQVK